MKRKQVRGGPGNRHRGSDQWLYVASGSGTAIIKGKSCPLRAGTLVLIEHGDRQEIRNTGRQLLKTLNFYNPPGYTTGGRELPAARPPGR
jgi:mannose-6-phosphate isomerase-like protein (cupin superfamily)